MRSPILFLIFNRPEVTRQVFEAIRKARPSKLYIAADGPRQNKTGEHKRCHSVLEIVSKVDWPCEVNRLIRTENLGCKVAVSSAIDWFFSQEAEGIILEDDCLPSPSFFMFCDELLEKYRDDDRVGMISGSNFQGGIWRGIGDYYFSRFCHIWGWATWARAWDKYDVNVARWPALKSEDWLDSLGFKGSEKLHWLKAFNKVHEKTQDTWDYQWVMACWLNSMLAVTPNINLIRNIGFGKDATHTISSSVYADRPTGTIKFPLRHPLSVQAEPEADDYSSKHIFTDSILRRIFRKILGILGVKK